MRPCSPGVGRPGGQPGVSQNWFGMDAGMSAMIVLVQMPDGNLAAIICYRYDHPSVDQLSDVVGGLVRFGQ